jgi:hypothetical protein
MGRAVGLYALCWAENGQETLLLSVSTTTAFNEMGLRDVVEDREERWS